MGEGEGGEERGREGERGEGEICSRYILLVI